MSAPPRSPPRTPGGLAIAVGGGLLAGLALAARGPRLVPDSASYLDNAPFRPPLYPLFLDAAQLLGGGAALRLVVVLQALIAALAVARFLGRLRRLLGMALPATVGALVLLLIAPARYAGDVSTECLTYSLFLLLLGEAIDLAEGVGGARPALGVVGLAVLAILARPQFLFLWPVLLVGAVALALARRERRWRLGLAALLVGGVAATWAIQAGYNQLRNGRPQGIHFTGIQLLTAAIYLADPGDVAMFAGGPEGDYAARVFSDLAERHLQSWNRPARYTSAAYYEDVYNDICIGVLVRQFPPGRDGQVSGVDEWAALDRLTVGMARRLLVRHPARYLALVVGLAYGYYKYLLVLVPLLLLLGLERARREPAWRLLVLLCLLWLANLTLVCMVETAMTRYLLYTDAPLVAAFLGLLTRGPTEP